MTDDRCVPAHGAQTGVRKPSVLDVQVVYDALVRHCVAVFNATDDLPPAIVAIGLGAVDGEIEMMGTLAVDDFNSLTAEGRDGPLMGEFFHQALVNDTFRASLSEAGHRPADMLAFVSEVMVLRGTNENGQDEHDESLMVVIHTPERSFRSMLPIEQGSVRKVFYEPLQLDMPSPGAPDDATATLSLDKMLSSNQALTAAHPLHDLHIFSAAQLH